MQADTNEGDRGMRFPLAATMVGLVLSLLIVAHQARAADLSSITITITITGELKVFDGDTLEVGPLLILARASTATATAASSSVASPANRMSARGW